jgi:hypothetical protein
VKDKERDRERKRDREVMRGKKERNQMKIFPKKSMFTTSK